jgi:imidazolonepropionase
MTAKLLTNAKIATCQTVNNANRTEPYGLIETGAVVTDNGTVSWCGSAGDIPSSMRSLPSTDLNGKLLTPALIDCHTHIIHGGHRAAEFELRLNGASYAEVAAAGGGIVSTVAATRSATVDELVKLALPRVDALLAEGVSVLEIKSGYGLDQDTELNMLRAARQIPEHRNVAVNTSFLGAHAVPAEYNDRADEYIDNICIPTLELAHSESLVDAVDGLPVKLHAEQLSLLNGAALAAKYQALSADHLEYLDEAGVKAMAASGTVAVLLPGAFYTLRETQHPPLEAFRDHRVPVAIATDANPGSSPVTSLLLMMNMACTLFRMTPEETLLGVTANAAKALGLTDRGQIATGMRADFCLWDVQHPAELSYRIGFNPLIERIVL